MLNIIKFELNIRVKVMIKKLINRKAVQRNGYKEYFGNKKILNKYGVSNCGSEYIDGQIVIIWDKEFYDNLNENEIQFIILHEIGHFKREKTLEEILNKERTLHEEVSADSNAFKIMGYEKALQAMESILNKLEIHQKDEFKQRIHMQKMIHMTKQYM